MCEVTLTAGESPHKPRQKLRMSVARGAAYNPRLTLFPAECPPC